MWLIFGLGGGQGRELLYTRAAHTNYYIYMYMYMYTRDGTVFPCRSMGHGRWRPPLPFRIDPWWGETTTEAVKLTDCSKSRKSKHKHDTPKKKEPKEVAC